MQDSKWVISLCKCQSLMVWLSWHDGPNSRRFIFHDHSLLMWCKMIILDRQLCNYMLNISLCLDLRLFHYLKLLYYTAFFANYSSGIKWTRVTTSWVPTCKYKRMLGFSFFSFLSFLPPFLLHSLPRSFLPLFHPSFLPFSLLWRSEENL